MTVNAEQTFLELGVPDVNQENEIGDSFNSLGVPDGYSLRGNIMHHASKFYWHGPWFILWPVKTISDRFLMGPLVTLNQWFLMVIWSKTKIAWGAMLPLKIH